MPGASACTMLQRAALRLSEGYGRNARDGTEHSLALCSTVTFEHSCAIMRAYVRRKYRRMSLNSMHNTNVHYIEAVLLTHDRSRCPRNSLTELRGVCGVNPAVCYGSGRKPEHWVSRLKRVKGYLSSVLSGAFDSYHHHKYTGNEYNV